MEYRFKEKGHRHEILVGEEWKSLTGVTTVLSVVAKPALIQWAANMAVDYIKDNADFIDGEKKFEHPFYQVADSVLEEARKAHCRKKEEAGQKGTDVHAEIEKIIKEAIALDVKPGVMLDKHENPQVQHFLDWAIDNKVKFLESEAHVYSEKMFLGGICDFVCEIEGETWIGDIKTGNGIYAEAFWQTAAYQMMFEEMKKYENIKGHIILNLKKDGSFEEKRSVSNEDNKTAFLSALAIYRIQQKVNGQIL